MIRIAGMRPDAAEAGARALIDAGCEMIVSFGLAGALTAGVSTGTIIAATAVIAPTGIAYATATHVQIAGARALPIAGSDAIVATREDKILLNQRTGAAAVDMESHRVAQVAHDRGIPFLAVRVVADRLESSIPRAVFDAVGADGRPRAGVVVGALTRRPWEIFSVMSLAAQSRAAHRSLRDVAPLLLAALGR
jgi:adenosylhomocysteine nucleosidase